MTEEDIKENLSNGFVKLIAARNGLLADKPEKDYGVDLRIDTVSPVEDQDGKRTLYPDGQYIDIQLKSTTESSIVVQQDTIRYNLRVKAYNSMVIRKEKNSTPIILILFILPNDNEDWLTVDTEQLILRKCAYWYQVPEDATRTNNASTIAVEIPSGNIVNLESLPSLISNFYSEDGE